MVPPSKVSVDELVVMLVAVVRLRLPARTNVPPDRVVPLTCVSLAAVKLSPELMVSVPVLLKLAAEVETLLPVPAIVRLLVLEARAARAFALPELMVPPDSVRVEELVATLIPVVERSRLPLRTKVPPDSVVPLICVSFGAVKLSPELMVSVPVLLKLAAVVETLLLEPAMVSFPLLVASPASALVLLEVFSMVPPARVRVVALVVMVCAVPVMFRFEFRTYVPAVSDPLAIWVSEPTEKLSPACSVRDPALLNAPASANVTPPMFSDPVDVMLVSPVSMLVLLLVLNSCPPPVSVTFAARVVMPPAPAFHCRLLPLAM